MFSFKMFVQALEFGDYALKYLEQLSRISRVAFTEGEIYTADYLGRVLRDLGYDTIFEEISFPEDSNVEFNQGYYLSHNIIATKEGDSDLEVIIGASYDSRYVEGSTGFERATGVSLLLELATLLKDENLPYTLKFVLFGDGIDGSIGATHYVSTRSQDEINNIMYYLNLSSIGSGKDLYISSNIKDKGFVREGLVNISKELGINLLETPENSILGMPKGAAIDIGDQVPFKYSNVPFGTLYATSFDSVDTDYGLPNDPTGDGSGLIEGSENDNYKYVMDNYSDNVINNLSSSSELIYNYLTSNSRQIKIITNLSEESLDKVNLIKYELFKDGEKVDERSIDEGMVVEFNDLDNGDYKIKVMSPKKIEFIKDINDFDFSFDNNSKGGFVIVNDELPTYTYREEFTDNYNSLREQIKKQKFEIKQKRFLFEYAAGGDYSDDQDIKNDLMIKNLSILLVVLVVVYVMLRLILMRLNRKRE